MNLSTTFTGVVSKAVMFLALLAFVVTPAFSQTLTSADYDGTIVKVKLTDIAANSVGVSLNSNGVALAGLPSLDELNKKYGALAMTRIFRDAGKHEADHVAWGLHRWYKIEFPAGVDVQSLIDLYAGDMNVSIAELKLTVVMDEGTYTKIDDNGVSLSAYNDPLAPNNQWHFDNTGQTIGGQVGTVDADIDLPEAHLTQAGQKSVIVQLIDTGADMVHEDLVDAFWVNPGEIAGDGIDNDNNGYIDDVHGYSHADNTGNTQDSGSHGSHTAGTVGATTNNGIGVAGVAGGTGIGDGVSVMISQAFGNTTTDGFDEALIYGADNGAVVSSNSWGYTTAGSFEQSVLDAIDYFIANAGGPGESMDGGIVVFAAGNDGDQSAHYPGFYAPSYAVVSTDNQDKVSSFSNFGTWTDISAPGSNVASTVPGDYAFNSGTSMACPHVAGLFGLIASEFPGITNTAAIAQIEAGAENIDALNSSYVGLMGAGRINALFSLSEPDEIAPDAITDVATANATSNKIDVTFTATGDDGAVGTAAAYDLRYSTSTITAGNFASATQIATGTPQASGATESFTVGGLASATQYYFAVIASDDYGNASPLSNVGSGTTADAPVIGVSSDIVTNVAENTTADEILTVSNTGATFSTLDYRVSAKPVLPLVSALAPEHSAETLAKMKSDNNSVRMESITPLFALADGDTVLSEDFNAGIPGSWTVIDNAGTGLVWDIDGSANNETGNWTGGSGTAASVSSDVFGAGNAFDTELITPVITGYGDSLYVNYISTFQDLSGEDRLDVDVTTDGGATWTNILRWNEDHGAHRATPGEEVTLLVTDFLAGATSFQMRWRYYPILATDTWQWYAQVDNVHFISGGVPWLALSSNSGTVTNGNSDDITVTLDATGLALGTYNANLVINSNDPVTPQENVAVAMTVTTGGGLPVELTSFASIQRDRAVSLRWETASEINNAGFEVQHKVNGVFTEMGFVDAKGGVETGASYKFDIDELPAGTHAFRLKQIDVDGTGAYSQVLEVRVEMPEAFELSAAYPNPFNPSTQFTLAVAETQNVTVEVFNALGQRVALLHTGELQANESHQFTFDASALTSGLYIYRASGENFHAVRRVMLVK